MPTDLIRHATEGFVAELDGKSPAQACPYYSSSPASMGWLVGAWLKASGRSAPRCVRMSRGYTVRVDGMLVAVGGAGQVEQVQ
jgi:hypothetical protein